MIIMIPLINISQNIRCNPLGGHEIQLGGPDQLYAVEWSGVEWSGENQGAFHIKWFCKPFVSLLSMDKLRITM